MNISVLIPIDSVAYAIEDLIGVPVIEIPALISYLSEGEDQDVPVDDELSEIDELERLTAKAIDRAVKDVLGLDVTCLLDNAYVEERFSLQPETIEKVKVLTKHINDHVAMISKCIGKSISINQVLASRNSICLKLNIST